MKFSQSCKIWDVLLRKFLLLTPSQFVGFLLAISICRLLLTNELLIQLRRRSEGNVNSPQTFPLQCHWHKRATHGAFHPHPRTATAFACLEKNDISLTIQAHQRSWNESVSPLPSKVITHGHRTPSGIDMKGRSHFTQETTPRVRYISTGQ